MKIDVRYAVMVHPPVDVYRWETCQLEAKDLTGLLAILCINFCEVRSLKLMTVWV